MSHDLVTRVHGSLSRRGAAGAVLAASLLLSNAAAALAQGAEAEPLPEAGTSLAPGRYFSDVLGPNIEFRGDEGWTVASADGPVFVLERTDQPLAFLTVTRFDGAAFVDSCDPTSLTEVEVSVPRLVEILAGNPYLNAAQPEAIEVDGHQGLQLDVGVPAYTECEQVLLIFCLPDVEDCEFIQLADQQSRFIVLDVGGDVIVVSIEAFPGVPFGGLLDASMELVDSMRIEPGEYVPPEPSAEPAEPDPDEAGPSPTPADGADASA